MVIRPGPGLFGNVQESECAPFIEVVCAINSIAMTQGHRTSPKDGPHMFSLKAKSTLN